MATVSAIRLTIVLSLLVCVLNFCVAAESGEGIRCYRCAGRGDDHDCMTLKNSQPIKCGANVTSCWLSMKTPESLYEQNSIIRNCGTRNRVVQTDKCKVNGEVTTCDCIGDVCNNNKLLQTYGQKSGGHKFTGDAGSAATRSHGYKFVSCLMMIIVSCLTI